MPEIKYPSKWVKIGVNIEDGDRIQFTDAGAFDPENENYTFNVIIVHEGLPGETKKFALNKGNFKIVSALYGSNSDAWVGKQMQVNKIRVRNPQLNAMVDGIELAAPVLTEDEKKVAAAGV